MNANMWQTFSAFGIFTVLLMICGIYCILVTRNLLRLIIGLELLTKAVTLLIIVAGYVTGQAAFTQSLVLTIIIIEVVVVAIAGGVALCVYRDNESIDLKNLRKLRG